MMTIEQLNQDGDALVVLFNRHTNVVIDYLFILLKKLRLFLFIIWFLSVLLWQEYGQPRSVVLLVPYMNAVSWSVVMAQSISCW